MLEERILRAKELLETIRHAAMATVNEDGTPHNTPYFFMHDTDLDNLYWGSDETSQHSQNVGRTGEIFVVLYEASERGGLYIKAINAHELSGEDLNIALKVHNGYRARAGKEPLDLPYYEAGPQRMYSAKPVQFWVNDSERNTEGLITREYRQELTKEQLL